MIQISTVILNWNGKKDTEECLNSMFKQKGDGFSLEIIVVDNGSTDNSANYLKKTFPNIKLIETRKNLGFTGGNNVGIREALKTDCHYILLLNNDTTVANNLVENLLLAVGKYNKIGAVSPMIYFSPGYEFHKFRYSEQEKGKVIWYAGGIIDWRNVIASNYGVDDTDIGQYEKEKEIDFATGAAVFLSRSALEEVGPFDEKYYLYLEDADLSRRMIIKGWKIIFAPDAKVWHKVSQSSGIGSNLNDYYISRNRLLFGMKFAPVRSKIALLKEAVKLLLGGRYWQKRGVLDFFALRFGKGSYV